MKKSVLAVLAGLAFAFVTMMIFECTNSFFFPFPEGMDTSNLQEVREFAASMGKTIYIMVFLGRIVGSLGAGYITTKISHEKQFKLSLLVAILLAGLGVLNNVMLGEGTGMIVLSIAIFLVSTYGGHRLATS